MTEGNILMEFILLQKDDAVRSSVSNRSSLDGQLQNEIMSIFIPRCLDHGLHLPGPTAIDTYPIIPDRSSHASKKYQQ